MSIIKIAIVDDQKMICETLARTINSFSKMQVINASLSGKQILDFLESSDQTPDLITLDIDMPGMDGLEVLKKIKATYPQIKVLMLTMHDESLFITKSVEYGANGFLTKNFKYEELEYNIRKVIENGEYFNEYAMKEIESIKYQKNEKS